MQNQRKNNTSWGKVSAWYDEYLTNDDTYQSKVILPNLQRIINNYLKLNSFVLDLGCGQGYFVKNIFDKLPQKVIGFDISSELLSIAKKNMSGREFVCGDAHDLTKLNNYKFDIIYSVLAVQNMQDLSKVAIEISKVIAPGGKIILVLNHPCFRVAKESDWHFDGRRQGRVVYNYMSDKRCAIDMNPGSQMKQNMTYSFHHPLQVYSKVFSKNGFAIEKIEEWISHKKSEQGAARAFAEDKARTEIPMFMCLVLTRYN